MSDREFKDRLDRRERAIPILLADEHYGRLMDAPTELAQMEAMRREWRERQERARARALRQEASMAES